MSSLYQESTLPQPSEREKIDIPAMISPLHKGGSHFFWHEKKISERDALGLGITRDHARPNWAVYCT